VWNAPEWYDFDHPLNNIPEYKMLVGLFVNTLEVEDLTIEHCLSYLSELNGTFDLDHTTNLLYSKIVQLWEKGNKSEASTEHIRYALLLTMKISPFLGILISLEQRLKSVT
jgi:hypothetical protein